MAVALATAVGLGLAGCGNQPGAGGHPGTQQPQALGTTVGTTRGQDAIRRTKARREAKLLMTRVKLPSGTRIVERRPKGAPALAHPASRPASDDLVDIARWAVVH